MINTRKDLKYYLQEDARRNGINRKILYYFEVLLNCENALAFRYIKTLRYCEYYSNFNNPIAHVLFFYYKCKRKYLGGKYGISIPLNRTGYGLRIVHLAGGGGVLLNVNKVGNYCGFNAGVLIGDNGKDKVPTIGDYVVFGPGAKAFGDITIGDNVFVAPNAVVRIDVPPNCIVGGIPAKIIKYK